MPFITIGIIASCFVVQVILTVIGAPGGEGSSAIDLRLRAADYVLEHPYLELSAAAERELFEGFPAPVLASLERGRAAAARYRQDPVYVAEVLAESRRDDVNPRRDLFDQLNEELERSAEGKSDAYRRAARAYTAQLPGAEARLFAHLSEIGPDGEREEQRRLDELLAGYFERAHADPFQQYGAKAGQLLSYRWVSHLFVHGGWLHLLGNMLFLWLVGFNVEDRWGRSFFTVFYLTAGGVAALTHFALAHPQVVDLPLVGASGAIAAVMGVFLMHFANTKIHVLWWSVIRFGTFEISAYLALPLWFLHQLLLAWLYQDAPTPVAHWAHAGGFAFGLGLAALFRVSGIENRFLSGRIEREDIVYEYDPGRDPEVVLAGMGEAPVPRGRDGWRPYVEALTGLRGAPVEDMRRAWHQAQGTLDRPQLSAAGHLRIARALQSAGLLPEAFDELRALFRQHGWSADTIAAALLLAEVLSAEGRVSEATAVLEKAAALPGLEPAWMERIRALRSRVASPTREPRPAL